MLYELVIITAVGLQSVSTYNDDIDCEMDADVFRSQKVPAACIDRPEATDAFDQMLDILGEMERQVNDKQAVIDQYIEEQRKLEKESE